MTMTLKEKRFSVREAIATAFALDFADVENDYRYQPGPSYTPCAVYAIGDYLYFTATKSADVKPKEGRGYKWEPYRVTMYGWQIWKKIEE